jgi:hypothetical protein
MQEWVCDGRSPRRKTIRRKPRLRSVQAVCTKVNVAISTFSVNTAGHQLPLD